MRLSNLLKAFKLITIENGVALCRYVPTLFGGGPSSTTSTVTQSTVPDWLKPQTQQMLAGATKQLFQTNDKGEITGVNPYVAYSTNPQDYVAGFSPMQQQAFAQAANLQVPGQYAQASDMVNAAGIGGMQSAQQALGYGDAGYKSGMLGQQFGLQSAQQAQDMANYYGAQGANYGQQAANLSTAAQGYGAQGAQSGQLGQQFGLQSAQQAQDMANYYGAQGANYGQQAANLAESAQNYGNAGYQSGQLGQQLGLQSAQQAQDMANYYGAQGANYGAQASNLAGQAQNYGAAGASYGDLASQLGLQGLQAQAYGMGVGQQARNYAAQAAATGQNYANLVTTPSSIESYMNPYQKAVTDIQKAGALRDFQVGQQVRQANAARSGAYGGARQAIENAEAQRNLNTQLQGIEATGLQNAYIQALANIGQQQQYSLQGLNAAQTGLGTALSGGQLGLSGLAQAISGQNAAMQGSQVGLGGVNAANQAYQTGIQGANAGLAGVGQFIQGGQLGLQGTAQGMQGAQAGLAGLQQAGNLYNLGMQGAQVGLQGVGQYNQATQTGLQGTAQGIQGAQAGLAGVNAANQAYQTGIQGANAGLSGVNTYNQATQTGLQGTAQGITGANAGLQGVQGSQQGYQLANTAGTNLSNIGTQQLAAQQGIINLQNQLGGQQQQNQQDIINAAINNYANAQNYPMQQFQNYNALIRGLGSTQTNYAPAPSMVSQLGGLGMTGLGAYMASRKEGGVIDTPKTYKSGGLVDLVVADALAEASK